MRTNGRVATATKEGGLRRNPACWHFDPGLSASRAEGSRFCCGSLVCGVVSLCASDMASFCSSLGPIARFPALLAKDGEAALTLRIIKVQHEIILQVSFSLLSSFRSV